MMMLENSIEQRIEARVSELVKLAPQPRDRFEMIAARALYSTLYHFEGIAVLAAKRGDGTENQLEDELVHRQVFKTLAIENGGVLPPDAQTAHLVDRLTDIQGPASAVLLNLVAETWLDTVFAWLGAPGWGAHLFRALEADEARHVAHAWSMERPDADAINADLIPIEAALVSIATSPGFALPVRHLRGETLLCDIGRDAAAEHRKVCRRLRVRPSREIPRLEAMCRANRMRRKPVRVPVSAGRLSLMRAGRGPLAMHTEVILPWPHKRIDAAPVLHTAGNVISRIPSLRHVGAAEKICRHARAETLLRFAHPEGIGSLHVTDPQNFSVAKLRKHLTRMRLRARQQPYRTVPALGELVEILPPAIASVAVTQVSNGCFSSGSVPLIDVEGVPILIGIGALKNHQLTLLLTMDHRIYDPPHFAMLRNGLVEELTDAS